MGNSAFKRSINNATRTRVNFLTPFYLTTRPNDLRPRLYNSNTEYIFLNRNVLYLSEEPPVPPSTSIASSTVCAAPSIFKLLRFSAFRSLKYFPRVTFKVKVETPILVVPHHFARQLSNYFSFSSSVSPFEPFALEVGCPQKII